MTLRPLHFDLDRIALRRASATPSVARLISAALSQLRFVTCLGSSCSQPTLAIAAIVERRIGPEGDLDHACRCSRRCCRGRSGCAAAATDRLLRGVKAVPSTQPSCSALRQRRGEVALDVGLRVRLHRVVGRHLRIIQQRLQHLVRAVAAIHRRNHRLNDGDRAVVRARIRPALQVVRLVDVPHADTTPVSSTCEPRCTVFGTLSNAAANSRSAGAE